MGEPMVQDGGVAGLEQSVHHPMAGRSQYNLEVPYSSSEVATTLQDGTVEAAAESLEQCLLACILLGKQEEASTLLRTIIDASVIRIVKATLNLHSPPTPPTDEELVIVGQLKTILQQVLQQQL